MGKNRLEVFSDGLIAIIITIMVLELKVPHGTTLDALLPLIPVFLSYLLSLIYVGIYASLSVAESWRVLIGPFFHANLLHWANNAVMLVFIGMISGTISRRHSVAVFLLGSTIAVLATGLVAAGKGYDSYVGVSAGVSALFGFCIAFGWRQPQRFPIKFAATLIAYSLLGDYLSWITNPDVSLVAHWTGLGVGIVWGLLVCEWRKYRYVERVSLGTR